MGVGTSHRDINSTCDFACRRHQTFSSCVDTVAYQYDMLFTVSQLGFPRWLGGKQSACQCRRHRFSPWVGSIPWSRK